MSQPEPPTASETSVPRRPPPNECATCEGLRTGIEVATEDDGTVHATVHVGGSLCDATAGHLAAEVDDLLDLGVSDVTVHLDALTICAADGRDAWDREQQLLEDRFGAVRFDD